MINPIWGNSFMTESKADNWSDRETQMVCATCVFYVEKGKAKRVCDSKSALKSFGRCRKHAPTLNGWPAMFDTDWCGDHKLDKA
jgi:hypothetical protein